MTALAPARLSLANPSGDGLYSLDLDDHQDHVFSSAEPIRNGSPSLTSSSWNWNASRLFSSVVPKKPAGTRPPVLAWRRQQYRSLTGPDPILQGMAAVHDDSVVPDHLPPSSPPELSYSKSSKSSDSSCRSSSLSDIEGSDKLSHFEDISIEENSRTSEDDSNLRPEDRPTLKRAPPRSVSTGTVKGLGLLSNGSRTTQCSSPGEATNDRWHDSSVSLSNGQSNPCSPSALMTSRRIVSRSPSPTKPFAHTANPISPHSAATITPRASLEPNSPIGALARRDSWQPRRKSVKELEAECDDNDEDVPDEAILENVPISPLPGQPKMPRGKSPSPSPHRTPSYGNLHSANVPRKGRRPSGPPALPNGRRPSRSPKDGRPRMIPHSASVPSFHGEPFNRSHRSKSWTEHLNNEAKQLSLALEEHAERLDAHKDLSIPNSATTSPPRPSLFGAKRSKTSIIDFPSVQKGHMMIDPLPISKEKEAVLTRTRPSWLPPKDQKEEKRHLKEWEQMMSKAAEAEKKRLSREKEHLEEKKEQQDSIDRIWDQHVLPNWESVVREPRTRELWWRGVTPRSRGIVWLKAIGNELALTTGSFEAARNRAHEMEENIAEMSAEERAKTKESAWFEAIERDVPSAFRADVPPELQNALTDVLKAYTMYRSDVGYVYGIHLPASILCLHMRPSDAFVALANLLNRPLPMAFLIHDKAAMARAYDLVLGALKYKFSKLHGHLTSSRVDISPEEYLDPLFRCLFAYNLSSSQVCRIWDILVFEGDKALVRASVAILGRLESKLYGTKEEILDVISWRNQETWSMGSDDEIVTAIREAGKVDATSKRA